MSVWIAERCEALTPDELLSAGVTRERDYDVVHIEQFWRRHKRKFYNLVFNVADRRARAATEVEFASFEPYLESSLDGADQHDKAEAALEAVEGRVRRDVASDARFEDWINVEDLSAGTTLSRAIEWRTLEILIHRERRRAQQSFDFVLSTDKLEEKNDSQVRAAAELFLSREFKFPYYYGPRRLAALAASNLEQFLWLAGDQFEELAGAAVVRSKLHLRAGRQDLLARRASAKLWKDIRRRTRYGEQVYTLVDSAGRRVMEDLKRWNVDVRYACVEPRCSTPIVVEEIFHSDRGVLRHRYLWTCPECGRYLPSFRPVTIEMARELKESLRAPSVFFFDRVSPGILVLARHFLERGSLIFFEPSADGDARQLREALQLCHVLKYSRERVRKFVGLLGECSALLHIETMGAAGLRYRVRGVGRGDGWREEPAVEVAGFRDAAGAGDWCTAGIAARICAGGPGALEKKTEVEVRAGVQFGQALAAWNCMFEGPRGGMYQNGVVGFGKAIEGGRVESFCPSCGSTGDSGAR